MARLLLWLLGISGLALLVTAPQWTAGHPYVLHMLVLMCIYAIPAVGLNLMLGYSGLVSLGHMGFAGLGAYTAAVLMVDARWSFWSALGAATLAGALAGVLIGLICFRFRGHFFMIVTLAFGLLLHAVMNNWDEVTRGAAGFAGIPRPRPIAWGEAIAQFLLPGAGSGPAGVCGAVPGGALQPGAHPGGNPPGRAPGALARRQCADVQDCGVCAGHGHGRCRRRVAGVVLAGGRTGEL
jgi:hypothetical protein